MSKKIKVTKSQQKVVEFKRWGNIAFFIIPNITKLKDLDDHISYPFTSAPYSISTPDGALAKSGR